MGPELVTRGWYPTPAHPRGPDTTPTFEMLGAFVYPSLGHPSGPSARPWYQLRGEYAYPVDGHPGGPSSTPRFLVVDDEVHPHPVTADRSPWFVIAARPV